MALAGVDDQLRTGNRGRQVVGVFATDEQISIAPPHVDVLEDVTQGEAPGSEPSGDMVRGPAG
jgi:hypothetical protein